MVWQWAGLDGKREGVKPHLPLIAGFLLLLAPLARAQVIINHAALDQLAGISPAPPAPPVRQPPAPRRLAGHEPGHGGVKVTFRPAHAKPPRAAGSKSPAALPAAPLPATPLPAAVKPPLKPASPPALLPAVLHFATGSAALPSAAAAILRPFCGTSAGPIFIDAHAAPDPADPSAAVRLSLSRAFAVRDALAACGIASARIIPRADGAAQSGDTDAARITATP